MKAPICVLVAGLSVVSAADVILNPTQDTDIYQFLSQPTTSIHTLGVSASGTTGPSAGHSQKSLVQFNVTPTTLGMQPAEIGSALLRLYILPDSTSTVNPGVEVGELVPGDISFYTQATSWSLSGSVKPSWQTPSPGVFIRTVAVTEPSTATTDVWLEVDVTEAVRSWAAGTIPNYGFLIQATTETAPFVEVRFASMEAGNLKPQLIVTKAPPKPLKVSSFALNGETVSLSWDSVSGTTYLVQESPDLSSWSTRDEVTATGASTSTSFARTVYPQGKGFYIIKVKP